MDNNKKRSENIQDIVQKIKIMEAYGKYGLESLQTQEILVPPLYEFATRNGEFILLGRAQRFGEKTLYGLYSAKDASCILLPRYESIAIRREQRQHVYGAYGTNYILATENGKTGAFNFSGKMLVPCEYSDIVDNIHAYYERHRARHGIYHEEDIPPAKYLIASTEDGASLFSIDGEKLLEGQKIIPLRTELFQYGSKKSLYGLCSPRRKTPQSYEDITLVGDRLIIHNHGYQELWDLDFNRILQSKSPISIVSEKEMIFKTVIDGQSITFNRFGKIIR